MAENAGKSCGSESKDFTVSLETADIGLPDLPFYFRHSSRVLTALKTLKTEAGQGCIRSKTVRDVVRGLIFAGDGLQHCVAFLIELVRLIERCNRSEVRGIFGVLFSATQWHDLDSTAADDFGEEATDTFFLDYVWWTALNANTGLLKLLLRFGVEMSLRHCPEPREFAACVEDLSDNYQFQPEGANEHQGQLSYSSDAAGRRHLLVFYTLLLLLRMEDAPQFSEDYSMCYQLLFDSTAETYVSCAEMTTCLENVLPQTHRGAIFAVMQKLRTLLPDVPESPGPRSLHQLCRVEIRKILHQNFNLPRGVSSLVLPDTLKRYLLLDDDGDYSTITKIMEDGLVCLPVSMTSTAHSDCAVAYIRGL